MNNEFLKRYGITKGNLPASYFISMTYEEQVIVIFKEIYNIYEELEKLSPEEVERIMNEKIAELKIYVDNMDTMTYNKGILYTDNKILDVTKELKAYANMQNIALEGRLMVKIKELEDIIEEINVNGIIMISPFTGELSPVRDIIYQLAEFHMNDLTVEEFDNLDLTAIVYDNKEITAYLFDWHGRRILLGSEPIPPEFQDIINNIDVIREPQIFTYTEGAQEFTLAKIPSIIIDILVLEGEEALHYLQKEDYTINNSIITITNPTLVSGNKVKITYASKGGA